MGHQAQSLPDDLRELSKIPLLPFSSSSQPEAHPYMNEPPVFKWSALEKSNKLWMITPTCLPISNPPLKTTRKHPRPGFVIRVVPDTNVYSHRHHELRDAALNIFSGDIQFAALPEVVRELHEGKDGARRGGAFRKLMDMAPSKFHHSLGYFASPVVFQAGRQPRFKSKKPEGDLKIKGEIIRLMREMERNFPDQKVILLFLTIDYGCHLLLSSIPIGNVKLICPRVDDREKGKSFQNLLEGLLAPYVQ
jgi:hypothetical protein